eukprot:GHVN01041622.1.p1 GENE.GHVN01041622.1~~GHVN01041622.1.p1  ORF type:complete len:784 (+),score=181.85 GHVN01041622.1:125-2353(+)
MPYTDSDVSVFVQKKQKPRKDSDAVSEAVSEKKGSVAGLDKKAVSRSGSVASAGSKSTAKKAGKKPSAKKGANSKKPSDASVKADPAVPIPVPDEVIEEVIETVIEEVIEESSRPPQMSIYQDDVCELFLCANAKEVPEAKLKPIFSDDEGAVFLKKFPVKEREEGGTVTPAKGKAKSKKQEEPEPAPEGIDNEDVTERSATDADGKETEGGEGVIYRKGSFDIIYRFRKEVDEKAAEDEEKAKVVAQNLAKLTRSLLQEHDAVGQWPLFKKCEDAQSINSDGMYNEALIDAFNPLEAQKHSTALTKTWSADSYNIYVGPKLNKPVPTIFDHLTRHLSEETKQEMKEDAVRRLAMLKPMIAADRAADSHVNKWPLLTEAVEEEDVQSEAPYMYEPSVYDEPAYTKTKTLPVGNTLCDRCFGKGYSKPCDACCGKGSVRAAAERGAKFTFLNKCLDLEDIHNKERFLADYRKSIAQSLGLSVSRVHALSLAEGSGGVRVESFIDGDNGLEMVEMLRYKVNNKNSTFFDTSFAKNVCRPRKCHVIDVIEVGNPIEAPEGMRLAYADEHIKLFVEEISSPLGGDNNGKSSDGLTENKDRTVWEGKDETDIPSIVVEPAFKTSPKGTPAPSQSAHSQQSARSDRPTAHQGQHLSQQKSHSQPPQTQYVTPPAMYSPQSQPQYTSPETYTQQPHPAYSQHSGAHEMTKDGYALSPPQGHIPVDQISYNSLNGDIHSQQQPLYGAPTA